MVAPARRWSPWWGPGRGRRRAGDQPTTPEGEEQPPDGRAETASETPTEDNGGGDRHRPTEQPEDGAGGESGGGLPDTGLELAALTMIGLGLLMAGLALWPTSSWPPPRDRLSRSTTRR